MVTVPDVAGVAPGCGEQQICDVLGCDDIQEEGVGTSGRCGWPARMAWRFPGY